MHPRMYVGCRKAPKWANKAKIKEVYAKAAQMRLETGLDWHVDHVLPIAGKLICGLHVHDNLEIIPASLNKAKRNNWAP